MAGWRLRRDMDEHEKILDDIIENHIFGETHKEYLKNDGSMNKSGLSLLRSIRAKPFSWNDRKIDGYQVFHLSERTQKYWKGQFTKYWKNFDFLNVMRERFIKELFYNKCQKCEGHGVDFDEPPPRGKCSKCKGSGLQRKTQKQLMEIKVKK